MSDKPEIKGGTTTERDIFFRFAKLLELERRFEEHLDRYEEERRRNEEELGRLIEAFSTVSKDLHDINANTTDLIRLQRDVEGAMRVGVGLQKFMIWLTKWGVIGTAIAAGISFCLKHFYDGGL